ncbi:ATP-binding cassette domain-containing protein [Actinoplanes couchii]|uniref:ABC transporter ATP-binding protein n=1 Tax=Actinoplanes couchii TaxID=403638 RepID=A0ABQ3XTU1_9ACTN|nr:ATP-binding cassette domain-containing protein [Actinoplanes couchii]MDR6319025.1 ABC-type multidrug transport system ATPase subunit [Actinoplanes couchii]GID61906.1 ABC transporter ATP-binding protein [Actinoplanes couchii]
MVRSLSETELKPVTWEYAVQAKGLRVKAGRHLAVTGLDLSIGVGVHGLLGPNGAGKTTLMRALATVLSPESGTLELLGRPVQERGADLRGVRRGTGYLPQEFGYYPKFTVREFVEYVAWLKEMPALAVPVAAERAIARVGLADRADRKLKELSGGMLRRAGVAQAIVNTPDLLLLDEPTVGLDPEQRLAFRELLRDLGADTCVLVSTHLVEDVVASCTDVVVVHTGRVVWQGTPGQLAERGGTGDPGDSAAERGYSALVRQARREAGA